MTDDLTRVDVFRLLREACAAAGGQKAWAEQHGISASYVNDVINSRRDPGDSILRGLGLVRVTVYRRVKSGNRRIAA